MAADYRTLLGHKPMIRCARGDEPHVAVKRQLAAAVMALVAAPLRGYGALEFGVSEPRFSDLVQGRIERFTCDSLINMLAHAGLAVSLTVTEAPDRRMGKRRYCVRRYAGRR